MHDQPRFVLVLHGLREFAAFCAIIRGQDLTPEALAALTTRLAASTDALADATEQASRHDDPDHDHLSVLRRENTVQHPFREGDT